jgi:hypothetical protein
VWLPVDSKTEYNATTLELSSLAASAQKKTMIARLLSPRPTNRPLLCWLRALSASPEWLLAR